MPQMKPLNWIMLYVIINMIMMMMNILNYFNKNTNLNNENKKKLNYKINNWMW